MNILAIGNSFSIDATQYLYEIACERDWHINLSNLYIGGCTLQQHANNLKNNEQEYSLYFNSVRTGFFVSVKEAILSQEWDVITVQQGSMHSFCKDNYYPYITELTDFIREHQPRAKLILHETWGYDDGGRQLAEYTDFSSFEEMSEAVIRTYKEVYNEIKFDGFIPSGELLLALRRKGLKELHRDGLHVSLGIGRYALALLWYRCLTGKSVADVNFTRLEEKVSDEVVKLIKETVDTFEPIHGMFGITGKLGFGCMRMAMNGDEVDCDNFKKMIDCFMYNGFNYFDTAHGYISGKSETAIKECLTSRYPRDSFVLTDKLSHNFFEKEEDVRPFFEKQLEWCGVDYFDFYLMHAQTKELYKKYRRCKAYETALELKKEGKIKHFGISFHDTAEVLEEILTDYPQIEVVQIQFNYLDYEDASVQSKKLYEICRKHGKYVLIMEPVKGGTLASLPDEAKAVFDELGRSSPASYALRFAAGFEGVISVLSGMGTMNMVHDNTNTFNALKPLTLSEAEAVDKVRNIILSKKSVQCTDCRYCMEVCPKSIPIPAIFACLNNKRIHGGWSAGYYYSTVTTDKGKACDCIECGACEDTCPQHLKIRELLKEASEIFDKKD